MLIKKLSVYQFIISSSSTGFELLSRAEYELITPFTPCKTVNFRHLGMLSYTATARP